MLDPDRLEWLPEGHSWTPDALHRELVFRVGVIVTAFTHVDYLASSLAIRAAQVYPVAEWAPRYPISTRGRLRFWREILRRPGPLAEHAQLGGRLLNGYERLSQVRHVVAHSHLRPVGATSMLFTRMLADRDTPPTWRSETWTPERLRREARSAATFSRRCAQVATGLNRAGLLPTVEGLR